MRKKLMRKLSSSDKTNYIAISTLICLAAVGSQLLPISSLSSSLVFKGSLQQLLPAFITAKKKLTGFGTLRSIENTLDWRSERLYQTVSV